ncbi:NUDIX domain-containing protein [Thalassorhabdomicrobium marinisediminis]|uniref:NUDIX hydrolase n=1 Tax=Thalassorhabdomicrobium marinisediminis TaxID=2170577 RepID=A0A2T7FZS4_9RHOB|nr:NUDIX hydrolase [Thalassorhabdomicrobium marinisediminis]PVA07672.1 NUDIX hydrolase [Thalassorhabdomicrobium marinisediminis]
MRRYGKSSDPYRRYRLRPGAYVILLRGGQLLLTRQDGDTPEMQLPGGGIDPDEHAIPALHREVMEETGWRMSRPRRLGVYKRFAFMTEYDLWAEKICTIYMARPTLRLGPPTEAGHTAIWVPLRDAPSVLTNSGDAAFVASLL